MHNTVLVRLEEFINAKIINLEKVKYEKYYPRPPPPPLLRIPAPAPYFRPFFIFLEPPTSGEFIKIYSPLPPAPLLKRE